VDVTSFLHSGTNVFQFIQLDDLSDYVFLLHASTRPNWDQYDVQVWDNFVQNWKINLQRSCQTDETTLAFYGSKLSTKVDDF
jgi:hypothetical protein